MNYNNLGFVVLKDQNHTFLFLEARVHVGGGRDHQLRILNATLWHIKIDVREWEQQCIPTGGWGTPQPNCLMHSDYKLSPHPHCLDVARAEEGLYDTQLGEGTLLLLNRAEKTSRKLTNTKKRFL